MKDKETKRNKNGERIKDPIMRKWFQDMDRLWAEIGFPLKRKKSVK